MAASERRGLVRWSPAEWGPRLLLLLRLGGCSGRIHRLVLTGEKRADTQLHSFGFYTDGSLELDVSLLRLSLQETEERTPQVGFSLSRVRSGSVRSYPTWDPHDCPLLKNSSHLLVLFLINTKDLQVQVRKHGKQKNLFISLGLLPKAPPEPGLLKPEHTASPKGDSESGLPCSWGGADEQASPLCPTRPGQNTQCLLVTCRQPEGRTRSWCGTWAIAVTPTASA